MTTKVLAYHGKETLKQETIAKMQSHHDADELVKGLYWKQGKGCMIGCLAHRNMDAHEWVAETLGFPLELAYLYDHLFEWQSPEASKSFPLKVLNATHTGADLSKVADRFKLWILENELHYDREAHPEIAKAVEDVIALYMRVLNDEAVDDSEWSVARSAASSTWSAENSAEKSTARSAWLAWAAAGAAWVTWSSAAGSAARAATSSAGWAADVPASYERMADQLIQILEENQNNDN